MTDIVTRLGRWNTGPATADLCSDAADEICMLRRQRMVLLELLADAADVIHNLPDECESQDEAERISELKYRIADARAEVMLAWSAK